MDTLKILLEEAQDNVLVAGSWAFLLIAVLAALADPLAALLPLILGIGCYVLARRNDGGDEH